MHAALAPPAAPPTLHEHAMPYKREYSWPDVKQLIADSEARPSPFSYTLAQLTYAAQKAIYDTDMLAFAPLKAQYDADRQAVIDQRKADVKAWKAAHPGVKASFGPLAMPAAPVEPVAPQLPAPTDFHGHAGELHHRYSDPELEQRGQQKGVASAFTRSAPVIDSGFNVPTQDQSILIRGILNSKLGQAGLAALDTAADAGPGPAHQPARLMITQAESLDVSMRVAKAGTAGTATPDIKQIKLIVDSGAASLHVVTCYPEDATAGGSQYMSDSSYSITTVDHGAAKAGPSVRWSTQTDKAIS